MHRFGIKVKKEILNSLPSNITSTLIYNLIKYCTFIA